MNNNYFRPYIIFCLVILVFTLSSCSTFIPQSTEQAKPVEVSEQLDTELNQELNYELNSEQQAIDSKLSPAIPVAIHYENLWDEIPHFYKIPKISNKRVEIEKKWYLTHPDYLYRVSKRAEPYLYLIVQQLEQRDMPAELALLPIIESAYQPYAYSRGRAAGIWQFVPRTGKYFGLKQNWWYDGRRDIYAATNAALDYLQKLNRLYDGDWFLTLAAYNAGEGTINKAIKRHKFMDNKANYWDLKLSRETMAYVPKLIAISQIFAEINSSKIKLHAVKNEPFLELVDCENHIDLAVAAELAEIKIDEIYKYNPGFNQWATDPQGPHHLLLPIENVNTFKNNLGMTRKDALIRWKKYKIKSGDSLSVIARNHGISISAIKKANRMKNSKIRAGKTLVIPVSSKSGTLNPKVNKQRDRIIAQIHAKKKVIYRVKKGDSLWTISRKYRIPYKKLAKLNHISPLSTLSIGQKLTIWLGPNYASKPSVKYLNTTSSSIRPTTHRVNKGDSLSTIAHSYNTSIKKIKRDNRLSKKKYLQIGQKLIIN